jgi:F-type H+-transporting ATPase subunit epsilon
MLKLKLISLRGVVLDQEVYNVSIPTPGGYITIYRGHADLISNVDSGELKVKLTEKTADDQAEYYAIAGGTADIEFGTVTIIVDEADHADSLSEKDAADAVRQAKELVQNATDKQSLDQAMVLLDRTQIRLNLATRRKKSKK